MLIRSEITNIFKNIHQKGFFHLLSANLLIQVVSFASQLFVAGILSPDDIGRIKIIQTYLSIFSIVAGMGFNASTLKLCSENRTNEEKNSLFQSALFFTILSTLSLYIIILFLNFLRIFSSDKLIQWLIPLGLFPLFSNSIFMVFVSFFQATKKIKLISNLTISNKLISIVAILILTSWYGIKGYYVAYNLSFILMLIISFRIYTSHFDFKINTSKSFLNFSQHWKYAKTSMFAYLFSEISAYVDILFLNFFVKDMHQIGFYSFALTLTVLLKLIPTTVQQITIPYFSSLSQQKNEFTTAFNRYNKMLYLIIILTLLAALAFAPLLLHLIFVGKYDPSMQFFPYLAIGWSLRLSAQLQNGAIFGLGKLHYNVYTSSITLIFNIVTISIFLYFLGITGAAYASIFGGIVFAVCSRYFFSKAKAEM
ncbi:MAG: oligosaccharide flippase family protein [Paludibacter sp.]|nr:oligosaccharide flippase family protein [Paludibacter sp.]